MEFTVQPGGSLSASHHTLPGGGMFKDALGAALVLAFAIRSSAAEGRTYVVDPARSAISIHIGRAGLFKFVGHGHEVLAHSFGGEVQADPSDFNKSTVSLDLDATALKVSDQGEPPADVPKVQARMVGPELLDVARFPSVTFRSTKVEGRQAAKGIYELRITGELTLHGVTRSSVVQVRVEVSGDTLMATGSLSLRHTDFGLTPVSVAGVVKVKNEIAIDFRITASVRAPSRSHLVPLGGTSEGFARGPTGPAAAARRVRVG